MYKILQDTNVFLKYQLQLSQFASTCRYLNSGVSFCRTKFLEESLFLS